MSTKIGFVGMTHLGLVSAAAGAERGFSMIGHDPDPVLIEALNRGDLPVLEPDLAHLVAANRDRLTFTTDPEALRACAVVYVAADVATDEDGRSDLSSIDVLLGVAYANTDDATTIVVLSQVPPGYSRPRQRPGRTLIYQVETLIFGQAVHRALYPERTIVGLADARTALPDVYRAYLDGHGKPPVLPMRYESAEMAKISINCCLVASVATANTLAELCERTGADWSEIAPALKLDARIGAKAYLTPGLGIAGGNLERDLATVQSLAQTHGTDQGVVAAWIANSRRRKCWAARLLRECLLDANPQARVAVLGLAYKENTRSIKNAPAIACLTALQGADLVVFDPEVKADVVPFCREAPDALTAAVGADALAILTPWPAFKALDIGALAQAMRGRLLIDPYRCLDGDAACAAGFVYFTLGAPPRSSRAAAKDARDA